MKKAKTVKAKKIVEPVPVKIDGRICFGISYFSSEKEAAVYAAIIQKRGETYNGGFFDGMPCGRSPSFDYVDPKLGQLYAVTTA